MPGPRDYPIRARFERYIPPAKPGGRGDWVTAGYRWLKLEPKRGEFQAPSGQNKAFFRATTPMPHRDETDLGIDITMRFVAGRKQYAISYVALDAERDEIVIDCVSSRAAEVIA